MKNIYRQYKQSNSYSDPRSSESNWLLCESQEEYDENVAAYQKKAEDYKKSDNAKQYGEWRMTCSKEDNLHAREYYSEHAWQGREFDCVGVCFSEHYERSDHYTYIIKPGTVTGLKECTDPGIGWMYGS